MLNRKIHSELNVLSDEIKRLKKEITEEKQAHTHLSVSSKDKKLRIVIDSMNELLTMYQEQYDAIHLKHEVVTHLNEIGTWDAEFVNGELNLENKNHYNELFRTTLGFQDLEDFPDVLESWYNTVSEQDMDMVNKAYEEHLFNSKPYDIEYRSKKKDGSLEWVHVRAEVIKDKKGKVYRHIGTLMNVHQSKLDHLKVQQLLGRLDLIEKSLGFSVDTLEGAWGIDLTKETNNEKFWFSPQFKRLLGYGDTDLFEPSNEVWLSLIHPEEQNRVRHDFSLIIDNSTDSQSCDQTFKIKKVTGEVKWFSMMAQVVRNQHGQPVLVSGVLRDINHEILRQKEDEMIEDNMNHFTIALDELAVNIDGISQEASELAQENEKTVSAAQEAKEKIDATKVVTDLIKNISDQTNLLGINASIEASLAGVDGKGFDVVAQEIVKLSSETTEAVVNIEDILNAVNESVLQIVDSINTMTEKINNQAAVSEEINSTAEVINERSSELLALIQNL